MEQPSLPPDGGRRSRVLPQQPAAEHLHDQRPRRADDVPPEYGSPTIISQRDTVRLHLVNAGYEAHSIHTHNHRFTVVEKDGGTIPEAARHEEDVVSIAPAERKTIEFEADADPGIYLMHCHKVSHATNGERYPGEMVTALVYEEVMDSEMFDAVLGKAGYEG